MANIPTNTAIADTRPEHHIHNTNDPLPGTKGADPTFDYSAERMEDAEFPPTTIGSTQGGDLPDQGQWTGSPAAREEYKSSGFDSHKTPFTERYETADNTVGADNTRHMQPDAQAGVHTDHHADHHEEKNHPHGKVGMSDKIVGKTQQVIGKVAHKPELQEKGELRQTEGKAAVQGEAGVARN